MVDLLHLSLSRPHRTGLLQGHKEPAMGSGLSIGAVVAISFNCVIALLIIILFLILCKACQTPSCPSSSPSPDSENRNEEKYLLQP